MEIPTVPFTKPATANSSTEWRNVPEGTWRFIIGKPVISMHKSQYGDYMGLAFPLELTKAEQVRLFDAHGAPPDGQQQSYRISVRGKLATAMGFYRSGKYETTKCGLAEMMCAAVGTSNSRTLREWMTNGGVPFVTDGATEEEEIAELVNFYSWFEELELYAKVRHEPDKTGKMWTRIESFTSLGDPPGPPEQHYQQTCANKVLRITSGNPAPQTEAAAVDPEPPQPEPVPAAAPPRTNNQPAIPVNQMTAEEKAARYRELFGEDAPIPKELVTA